MSEFKDRMQEVVKIAGGITALSKKSTLSVSVIRKYINGESDPSRQRLIAIAKATGVSLEWLMWGKGSMMQDQDTIPNDEFIYINRLDVEVSAGAGATSGEELVMSRLAFRRDWIREKGANPNQLNVIRAKGDSMEPTIEDGNMLLVEMFSYTEKNDHTQTTHQVLKHGAVIPRDGIYVIRMENHLMVKRLQLDLTGGLIVKSDNPIYEKIHISKEGLHNIIVVGRVIWASRTL